MSITIGENLRHAELCCRLIGNILYYVVEKLLYNKQDMPEALGTIL